MSRQAAVPGRAREYETIYILRPDIDADSAERLGTRLSDAVTRESGRLAKVEAWGRRRLAYDIAKHKRGVYMYLKYMGGGSVVAEIERNLRLSDAVLKYQTVLVREDVPVEAIAIAEEDVKFERLELTPLEDEREDESRERQLGLIEPERRERREEVAPEEDGDEEGGGAGTDEEEV